MSENKIIHGIEAFDQVIVLNNTFLDAYMQRAKCYFKLRRSKHVIQDSSFVISACSSNLSDKNIEYLVESYCLLGRAHLQERSLGEAKQAFSTGLTFAPQNQVLIGLLNECSAIEKQMLDAVEESTRRASKRSSKMLGEVITKLDAENHLYYIRRAKLYISMSQFEKAFEDIERAQKINSSDPKIYYLLASYHLETYETDKARIALDQGLSIAPQNKKLIQLQLRINEKELIEQLAEDKFKSAQRLIQSEQYTEAGRALIEARKLVPNKNKYLLLYLEVVLLQQDVTKWGFVEYMISTLVKQTPKLPEVYDIAIKFYTQQKQDILQAIFFCLASIDRHKSKMALLKVQTLFVNHMESKQQNKCDKFLEVMHEYSDDKLVDKYVGSLAKDIDIHELLDERDLQALDSMVSNDTTMEDKTEEFGSFVEMKSQGHINVPEPIPEPMNILFDVYSGIRDFAHAFVTISKSALDSQRDELLAYILRAYNISRFELMPEQEDYLLHIVHADKQKKDSMAALLWNNTKLDQAVMKLYALRIFMVDNDKHSFYTSDTFEHQSDYVAWKQYQRHLCKSLLEMHNINVAWVPRRFVGGESRYYHETMITLLVDAIVESMVTHQITADKIGIAYLTSYAYGLSKVFVDLLVLSRLTSSVLMKSKNWTWNIYQALTR